MLPQLLEVAEHEVGALVGGGAAREADRHDGWVQLHARALAHLASSSRLALLVGRHDLFDA